MLTKIRHFALLPALALTGIAGTSIAQATAESDATTVTIDDEALKTLIALAESGNADGQFELGERYFHGVGVPQSYDDARGLFEKASMASNHAGAQYKLGLMYENGEGVAKSCTQALEWFQLAAMQGYKDSAAKAASLRPMLYEASCQP